MWLLYINTVEQKQESHIRKIHHQPPAMLSGLLGLLSCVWPGQLQAHRTRTMSWWGAGGGHGHVSPGWDEVGQGVFLQKVQLSLAYFVRSHERTRTGTFPQFFSMTAPPTSPHYSSAILKHIWTKSSSAPQRRWSSLRAAAPYTLTPCHPGPPLLLSARCFVGTPRLQTQQGLCSLRSHTRWKVSRAHPPSLFTLFPHISRLLPSINFSQGAFHKPSTVVSQSLPCCFWRWLSPGPPNAEPADSLGLEL